MIGLGVTAITEVPVLSGYCLFICFIYLFDDHIASNRKIIKEQ
jgi:hypothetical protein